MAVSLDKTPRSIEISRRLARWNSRLRRNDLKALRWELALQSDAALRGALRAR
ncbi:hypothetical protein PV708_02650 [Streptomyces sp. ME02-6977A]|uniref:hypothetical protein n=1 Tax=Streptomyces sp. ME02-6977A TaxID=3028671 RepID=UPI0029B2622A|nr:hypothetical protein [Streptomyces sp. ME02-6977A]MDX3405138.1 hypothetical protein [Streptomyces sp. ME02-6977A]